MKHILITGADSYIGTSVEKWLGKYPNRYEVSTIDMTDSSWREKDFSLYDAVFHVAGIAHADVGHVSEERKQFYYKINTDLAVETAGKARDAGVKQFIFMSSMIVYGDSAPIGRKKVIYRDTVPDPANFYGDSKLQAEKGILALKREGFRVVVLRPPMIYGKGSRGNYRTLSRIAGRIPFFPDIKNERSMLFITSLCEFIRLMIEHEEEGIFFPQNEEYVQTSRMVKLIGQAQGRNVRLLKGTGLLVWCLGRMPVKAGRMVNKAFGNLVYDREMSRYPENYWIDDLETSIRKTESDFYE